MSQPELVEFWMEYVFAEPMTFGGGPEQEAVILARMRAGDMSSVPIVHEGVAAGTVSPVEVRLDDEGRVMRVRFDLGDLVMPSVQSGDSYRRTDGYDDGEVP